MNKKQLHQELGYQMEIFINEEDGDSGDIQAAKEIKERIEKNIFDGPKNKTEKEVLLYSVEWALRFSREIAKEQTPMDSAKVKMSRIREIKAFNNFLQQLRGMYEKL